MAEGVSIDGPLTMSETTQPYLSLEGMKGELEAYHTISESEVAQLCPNLCGPMDCNQAPPSMGFSRQEHWSG